MLLHSSLLSWVVLQLVAVWSWYAEAGLIRPHVKQEGLLRTWYPSDPECRPAACPRPLSEAWRAMSDRCCKDTGTLYHCQTNGQKPPIIFCMDNVLCPAGTYANLSVLIKRTYPKEPLCRKCSRTEFQPHPTESYMFSRPLCQHKRRTCSSLNAERVRKGSAVEDDVCRCLHSKGFRPVSTLPDNDCSQFYSRSGCKCERKSCRRGRVLTEGYLCQDSSLAEALYSFDSSSSVSSPATEREPAVCKGDYCAKPGLQAKQWVDQLRDLHQSYGLWLPVLLALVCCLLFTIRKTPQLNTRQDPARQDTLVCVFIPSSQHCRLAYGELLNCLPLLERLYGPLILDQDPQFRFISVIVRPYKVKAKIDFQLLQFVEDLLTPMMQFINKVRSESRIVALHGTTSELKKKTFDDINIIDTEEHKLNSGGITLHFSNKVEERAVLLKLTAATQELEQIFDEFHLKLESVRQGSIKFRFILPHGSADFNSLAAEGVIRDFMLKLLSYESFMQLQRREEVLLEFLCASTINSIPVIQATNLVVQIGLRNEVHIGQTQARSTQQTSAESDAINDLGDTRVEMSSYHIVSLSRQTQAIYQQGLRLQGEEAHEREQPLRGRVQIFIRCEEAVSALLHEEWSGELRLLRRLWPNCSLRLEDGRVWWDLEEAEEGYSNVAAFVSDIFCTRRLEDLKEKHHVDVDVVLTANNASAVMESKQKCDKQQQTDHANTEQSELFETLTQTSIPALLLVTLTYGIFQSGAVDTFGLVGYAFFFGFISSVFVAQIKSLLCTIVRSIYDLLPSICLCVNFIFQFVFSDTVLICIFIVGASYFIWKS